MGDRERVVTIGFLTARDLQVLGQGFKRAYPLPTDGKFWDLLNQIDAADDRLMQEMRSEISKR